MVKAAFFINDVRLRRNGEFLVLEARQRCPHGNVFDEIYLTLPIEMARYFNIEQHEDDDKPAVAKDEPTINLAEIHKRLSSDN